MIYLIGGTARSGKTSLRKYLLRNYQIAGIETDSLRTIFELALPELGIHYQNSPRINAKRMEPFTKAFIRSRLFFEEDFVIEGDCITPEVVSECATNKNIKMLFIGYPMISSREKMKQLCLEREGWVKHMSDHELNRKVRLFINDSKILQLACKASQLPFIDASALSLDEVMREALSTFGLKSQRARAPQGPLAQ